MPLFSYFCSLPNTRLPSAASQSDRRNTRSQVIGFVRQYGIGFPSRSQVAAEQNKRKTRLTDLRKLG